MFSYKSVRRDLLLLQQAMVNNHGLECKNLFDKYERILQSSMFLSGADADSYEVASSIPDDAISWCLMPTDIPANLSPKTATADGNCLYFSASIALTGTEVLAHVLRLLVAAELFLEADFYAGHPYFKENLKKCNYSESTRFAIALSSDYEDVRNRRDVVVEEAKVTCRNGKWGAMLQIMALTSGIGRPIFAVYPDTVNQAVRSFCHGVVKPRMPLPKEALSQQEMILIMWTRTSLVPQNAALEPNHFVPLIPSSSVGCNRSPFSFDENKFPPLQKSSQVSKR